MSNNPNHATTANDTNFGPRLGRRGAPLKDPRYPADWIKQYNTARYRKHVPGSPPNQPQAYAKFNNRNYGIFDHCKLFTGDLFTTTEAIPKQGVRLDDFMIAVVLENFAWLERRVYWPADFDHTGMVRAERWPLGLAAKGFAAEGDIDVDGKIVTREDAGEYYKWFGGIHALVGEEGEDMYTVRPSNEFFKCELLGFKKGWKAKIQGSGSSRGNWSPPKDMGKTWRIGKAS